MLPKDFAEYEASTTLNLGVQQRFNEIPNHLMRLLRQRDRSHLRESIEGIRAARTANAATRLLCMTRKALSTPVDSRDKSKIIPKRTKAKPAKFAWQQKH